MFRFSLICWILLYWIMPKALAQSTYELTIKHSEDEMVINGLQQQNGTFYLTGCIGDIISGGEEVFDPYIIKIYPDGSFDSLRIQRTDTSGYFYTIDWLDNGNLILTGACKIDTSVLKFDHLWICIIDTALNVIDDKIFYMLKGEYYRYYSAYSLVNDSGEIIVAGAYHYGYGIQSDMVMIKLNQLGDTIATKTHPFFLAQYLLDFSSIPYANQNMLLVNRINSPYTIMDMVTFDADLNIVDITAFHDTDYEPVGVSTNWIDDTRYLLTSMYLDNEQDEFSLGICLVDSSHNKYRELILDKPDTLDYPAWINSHAYVNDTTIYMGGFENYLDFYVLEPTIMEIYLIDNELNLIGHVDIGGDINYELTGVLPSNDGGCLLYGQTYTNPYGIQEHDIYIRKMIREELYLITEIVETPGVIENDFAFPNPAGPWLNIPLNGSYTDVHVKVFDIAGRKFLDKHQEGNGNCIRINTKTLKPGNYLYQVTRNAALIKNGKFIKK